MTLQQILVKFRADTKQLNSGIKGAESRLATFGRKMGNLGLSLTKGITLPLAAVGVAAFKFTADFDKSMTQSTSIMGDLSDSMRQKMEDVARTVGKTTTIAANEAAGAYYYLASAGLKAEQSLAALPVVSRFAIAGQFDLATATDLLTDAQSALGLSSQNAAENMKQMTRVADVLSRANQLANASTQQFSTALTSKAAVAARIVGKEVEEVVAVLASLADQGIKAEEAGNALNMALRDLKTKAYENANEFKRYKVAVYDANGEIHNMADIVEDLEKALAPLPPLLKTAALKQLGFADKSQAAILALVGTSDKIRRYEKELKSAAGTMDKVTKLQMDNMSDRLTILWNKIKDVAIGIGKELTPAFELLIDVFARASDAGSAFLTWFRELPEVIRETTKVLGGLLFVAGPILMTLEGLGKAVWKLKGALAVLAPIVGRALLGPWGLAASAIAAVGIALVKVGKTDAPKFQKGTKEAFDALKKDAAEIEGHIGKMSQRGRHTTNNLRRCSRCSTKRKSIVKRWSWFMQSKMIRSGIHIETKYTKRRKHSKSRKTR
jgi:TP901 family phage tail tape measure protein